MAMANVGGHVRAPGCFRLVPHKQQNDQLRVAGGDYSQASISRKYKHK